MLPNQKQAALPNRYIPIEDFIREFEAGATDMGEVFDRYESTEKWTPDRLQVIRDIAHSDQRPEWMNDDALSLIDTAYDYIQQAGGAPLPTELSSLLDTFPSFETPAAVEAAPVMPGVYAPAPGSEYTLGGEYTPQIPTTPTGGEAQYYGMTPEQWATLTLGQKVAMRTMSTSVGAGITTGVVAGAQGGLPGVAIGAGIGALFGSLGENPAVQWIGNALDWAVETAVMRPAGFAAQVYKATQGGGKVTLDQIFADMDSALNAFRAGEEVFRVNLPNSGQRPENYMGAQLTPEQQSIDTERVWAGPSAPLEYRMLTPEQQGTAALNEYFLALENGARPEELNAEFEQRYGFAGQMTDLAARIFLDPLNFAPALAVRAGGKILGAVLGTAAGPIAKGTEVSIGPVQAFKNTKARMMEMSFADTQQVTPLLKWMSGWTKEGTPKALEKPVYSNAISKAWGNMRHLTPTSRASEFISMGSQYESVLIGHLGNDPFKYMDAYDLIAKNQVSAASEIGMKALGGPEMGAQIGAMRDTSPAMHAALDDYQSPGMMKLRADMQAIARATGASLDEVAVKLADVRDGKLNAQTWLAQIAKTGDEAARAIDEATLAVYADAIGKVPWNEKQLTAKLFVTSLTGKRDWAGAYFGVAPDGLPMRLNNLRKSIQGALLLDLSIPYLAQNVLNNQVLLIREGGVMSLIPVNRAAYLDEQLGAGIRPSRLHEGLVTDVTSPASFAELQAQKPGLLTTIEKGVSKFRKLGVGRIASGLLEGSQREAGWVTFHKKFMAENKRMGRGLDYMPADLADLIDNTNPALKRAIYGEIAASNTRPEMIRRVTDLLGGKRQVTAEALVPDLARRLGMDEGHLRETLNHPQIGVMDWIRENIPADATPELKRQKMADMSVLIQKRMNKLSNDQLLYKAEKAANTQGAEGALGAMEVLDDPAILRGEQRLNDWQAWEHVWDMKRDLTEEQFGSRVQMEYNRQKASYKTLHQNIRASYLGVLEKLGVDSSYGKALTDNLIGDEKLWTDYYDTVSKEYRNFFKENKGKFDQNAWYALKDRLSTLYNDTYKGSLDLQAKRDTQLIDLLGEKYGQDVRGMAEEWLTGIRKLDQEMFERMEAFRASLDDLDPDQKGAAWTAFLNKEHKPKIMLRMAQNREMARRVYVAADAAERAAPQPTRRRPEYGQVRKQYQRQKDTITKLVQENEALKLDKLTGLKLGELFDADIEAAPIKMAADLAGLRALNNKYGHSAGDILLMNFADTLRELDLEGYRSSATGRGDEFWVVFDTLEEAQAAEKRMHEVFAAKSVAVVENGQPRNLAGFEFRAGIADTTKAADLAERAVREQLGWPEGQLPPGVHDAAAAPPAADIVAQARAEWVKKTLGMTEEQHANITEIRQIASEFGIPSAKPDGSLDTGFNSRVLAIVNKYTGQKFNKLEEVSPAMVRRALEDRAKVKASPETRFIETTRGDMPEGLSQAVRNEAEVLRDELRQGEAGKRLFTYEENKAQPTVTGQTSTNAEWYRKLYFDKGLGRKQVEAALDRIIEDKGKDDPRFKNVTEVKGLILDRLMGYTDPMSGVDVPPNPAALLFLGKPDDAAKALAEWMDQYPEGAGYENMVRWAGSDDALALLIDRMEEPGRAITPETYTTKSGQIGMFGQAEDTPLFSGTPMRGQEQVFRPAEVPQQERMFSTAPEMKGAMLAPERIGDYVYFKREGELYKAPADTGLDINGQPLGARWEAPAHLADERLQMLREQFPAEGELFQKANVYTEPINEGEVLQLAQEIDAQRIEDTLNGWAKDVGRKEAATVSNPDPDPIGIAPPGAVASTNKSAPLYDIFQDGMNEQVAPALRELERMLVEPDPIAGIEGTIPPDLMRRILLYAEQQGNNLADTKLAASKFATMSTDMAMLNYNQRYGFDDIANAFVPYQFWATRNAVNWALSAIDRPYWFAWNHRIHEAQEKMQREEPGFPERLKGKLRISVPFLPDDWGGSIYYDPMHQIFPFEAITTGLDKTLQRDFSNQMRRAQQIVYERMENGDVSEQEAEEALRMQTGSIWDDAYLQAQTDLENEVASPLDLVTTMISPSMDINWFLERIGWKQRRNFGPPPSIATIQNLTSFLTPGGVNIPEQIQRFLGAAEGKNRGDSWNYFVMREMSRMAGTGADPDQILLEMVDKKGPLYTQAVDTVGKQTAVKSLASIFWADFLPEGEQEMIRLRPLFEAAADQGKIGEFLDEHPEYAAQLMKSKADDPEQMLRIFVRASVWDEVLALDPLELRAVKEQFGDLFVENFYNKETRNYDSIDTQTLVQWARALNGVVPETAPETPALDVELPGGAINERYNAYVAWRDAQPGYGLYNVMYGLPEGMRGNFRMQHPEVAQYEEARYIFIADNPELMPYIIGEDNALFGAPLEVQMEVYDYRAEKAELFPLIGLKNDYYWTLDKVGQKAYLRANPDLKDYWDWNRERVDELSTAAFYYVKGEMGIEKLRDASYEAPYQVDFRKFDPALTLEIGRQTLMGRQLGSGALASLRLMWEREGEPLGSFDEWMEEVLYAFAPQQ
jgi:GGDEF domain-containing protein